MEEPATKETAWHAELAFPLVSPDNSRPGIHSLQVSVQLRRDSVDYEGAQGGVSLGSVPGTRQVWTPGVGWTDFPWFDRVDSGEPNLTTLTKSDTTWRAGLFYQPAAEVTLRMSWQKSFKAPLYNDLFDRTNPRTFPGYFIDPYHPDGELPPGIVQYVRETGLGRNREVRPKSLRH